MISSKRTSQAYAQGSESCRKTRGVHKLTVCPYSKFTAQSRAFGKGWSQVWQVGYKFWAKSNTATKID